MLSFPSRSSDRVLTMDRSYQAGQAAFLRYRRLVSPTNLPFVRASSGQRVIDSATNWTAGKLCCESEKRGYLQHCTRFH